MLDVGGLGSYNSESGSKFIGSAASGKGVAQGTN
jgi:hypothetical protein